MNGMSDKNGSYDGTSGYSNNCGSDERRSHRAYRDPTADTAIANVMREEGLKMRAEEQTRVEEQRRKRRENHARKDHTRTEQKAASFKQDGMGGALYAEE